jgi:hypothetical protein
MINNEFVEPVTTLDAYKRETMTCHNLLIYIVRL